MGPKSEPVLLYQSPEHAQAVECDLVWFDPKGESVSYIIWFYAHVTWLGIFNRIMLHVLTLCLIHTGNIASVDRISFESGTEYVDDTIKLAIDRK